MGPMEDTEAYVSLKEYVAVLSGNPEADYQDIYDADYAAGDETWHIAGIHESTLQTVLAVSPDSFQRILNENGVEDGDQVSITIKDYAYAERVIANLEKAGYIAVSPYILGATTIVASLAAQRMQTLYVCIGALLAILLLQMIVLRALFGMENDSYRVLSDMGLTCRTAKRSVFWQLLLFTLVGQILGIAGIMVCSAAGVERIMNLTKYLYGGWWFGISVVHLMSTMLAAWYISAGLKKRVYPSTARRSDLPMDDEEVAV